MISETLQKEIALFKSKSSWQNSANEHQYVFKSREILNSNAERLLFDQPKLFLFSTTQQTQNICITFLQRWPKVFDVGPTLYKCYTNVVYWVMAFINLNYSL